MYPRDDGDRGADAQRLPEHVEGLRECGRERLEGGDRIGAREHACRLLTHRLVLGLGFRVHGCKIYIG